MSEHDEGGRNGDAKVNSGCCSGGAPLPKHSQGACCSTSPRRTLSLETEIDPVCGMEVDRSSPTGGTADLNGTRHYFCSVFCRAKFADNAKAAVEGKARR